MAYPQNPPYQMGMQQPYYPQTQPMPDQLAQLRQQQNAPYQFGMQQPMQMGMQQAQAMPAPMQTQPSTSPLWVQGEAGAKAYPVAPGNTIILMDAEASTFYLKTVDASGIPTMRTFDYKERTAAQNPPTQAVQMPQGDYVTRDEFNALRGKIEALLQPASTTVTKEE